MFLVRPDKPVPRPGPTGRVRATPGGPGKSGAMRRDRTIFRLRKIPDPPFTEGPPPWRRIGAGRAMSPPPPLPLNRIAKNGWLRVPVGMWAKPSISPLSAWKRGKRRRSGEARSSTYPRAHLPGRCGEGLFLHSAAEQDDGAAGMNLSTADNQS